MRYWTVVFTQRQIYRCVTLIPHVAGIQFCAVATDIIFLFFIDLNHNEKCLALLWKKTAKYLSFYLFHYSLFIYIPFVDALLLWIFIEISVFLVTIFSFVCGVWCLQKQRWEWNLMDFVGSEESLIKVVIWRWAAIQSPHIQSPVLFRSYENANHERTSYTWWSIVDHFRDKAKLRRLPHVLVSKCLMNENW